MTSREPLCVHCDHLESEHADLKCLYMNAYFEPTDCGEYVDSHGTQCEGTINAKAHEVVANWLDYRCNFCGLTGSRPRRP